MSSVHTHVVGKLVNRYIKTGKGGKSGPWQVVALGGAGDTAELYHYGTRMLRFTRRHREMFGWGPGDVISVHTGHGSRSDQQGVNAALWALESRQRYSRDVGGGGPRINPRRFTMARRRYHRNPGGSVLPIVLIGIGALFILPRLTGAAGSPGGMFNLGINSPYPPLGTVVPQGYQWVPGRGVVAVDQTGQLIVGGINAGAPIITNLIDNIFGMFNQ